MNGVAAFASRRSSCQVIAQGAVLELQNPGARGVRGNKLADYRTLAEPAAFIHAEDKQFILQDRTATAAAEAVVNGERARLAKTVELPGVGTQAASVVVLVSTAVQLIGSGLGEHGDLAALRAGEARSRTGCHHTKLLNALGRDGDKWSGLRLAWRRNIIVGAF